MWDLLVGLADVAWLLSCWRVLVAVFAGLAVGFVVNYAFADSSGFFPMFFAIAALLPGYAWHRRSQDD
jgi:hypothetical protein